MMRPSVFVAVFGGSRGEFSPAGQKPGNSYQLILELWGGSRGGPQGGCLPGEKTAFFEHTHTTEEAKAMLIFLLFQS